MAAALLTATNGNVTLAAGGLVNVPAGALTGAMLFRRHGSTTDGFEALSALETAGNQIIVNMGTDATATPYELRYGQGGATRTFGFNDLADNNAYLWVVRKTSGTVTPRSNLYRFDDGVAWQGWADGNGTVENRADVISRGRLLNQQGGFPLNGGIWVAAWWNVALAEADIVHAANGLHIGVDQWLAINGGTGLISFWRPGMTDPVQDEAPGGTSDETTSSGVTITAGAPTGFNMEFSAGGAAGELAAALGLAPALTGARASAGVLATVIDLAPALAGARASAGGLDTGVGLAPALAGARDAAGVLAAGIGLAPALTGARASAGELDTGVSLAPALTGEALDGGALAGTLNLAPALAGVRRSAGVLAASLTLSPSLAGARRSVGALGGTLHLAPGLTAVRTSLGTLNTPLVISPALTGSNGQADRQVFPFPFPVGPVSGFPWPPRPVKSFQEVTE
jgi:hypothetical protein